MFLRRLTGLPRDRDVVPFGLENVPSLRLACRFPAQKAVAQRLQLRWRRRQANRGATVEPDDVMVGTACPAQSCGPSRRDRGGGGSLLHLPPRLQFDRDHVHQAQRVAALLEPLIVSMETMNGSHFLFGRDFFMRTEIRFARKRSRPNKKLPYCRMLSTLASTSSLPTKATTTQI